MYVGLAAGAAMLKVKKAVGMRAADLSSKESLKC